MPELPEVETARLGLAPRIVGKEIAEVIVRQPALRFPVPRDLAQRVVGHKVRAVERRAKYLLLRLSRGTILIHLGMSGSLSFVTSRTPPGKHDHVDVGFSSRLRLRLRDPRRFGAVLFVDGAPEAHPLLAHLGPEPLSDRFDGDYLRSAASGRRVAIKNLLMNARVVVGVGNIYASEALHLARVNPRRQAGRLSRRTCDEIVAAVEHVLGQAIERGGTTLRDFQSTDGEPGAYGEQVLVYGREGEPCPRCEAPIRRVVLGQRSTYYCARCQR